MGDQVTQEDGERDTGEEGLVGSKRSERQSCGAGRWNWRFRVEMKAHNERGGSCHVQGAVQLSREDWLWDGGHSHPC